jgi:hypothetical protein
MIGVTYRQVNREGEAGDPRVDTTDGAPGERAVEVCVGEGTV